MSTPPATAPAVRAAGAVLWRRPGGAPEIALVHRPRYDDWSFPKGKLERGESMSVAAVREVGEETGQRCRLGAALGDVHYAVPEGAKLVRYWAAEALGGEFMANSETDELRWVDVDKAAELLSYRHDVDVLHRFAAIGTPTSTVVLVRHAKAGSRQQWTAGDDLRPLSGTGHEQAQRLATVLPLFGPDRIAAAPPVRCRDTVAPLAADLGLPVTEEPLLGEEGYWEHPAAGLARLREIAATPGVTVVCSQGGVIPDVVGELADAASRQLGIDPDDVPSAKASTWVLTFAGAELRAADYRRFPYD
ncbi:NUDIX hydrolase [Pseudonocardia sp. GCM10023141]|uniref:NUDIX hydrolase n=1 Tax=Pseudonocardia sp. GCM10023141 TaxID=3252653 RepID=UPI003619BD8E